MKNKIWHSSDCKLLMFTANESSFANTDVKKFEKINKVNESNSYIIGPGDTLMLKS